MPYTLKQKRFFQAVEHGMKPRNSNLSAETATTLAHEAESLPTKPPVSGQKSAAKAMLQHRQNNRE